MLRSLLAFLLGIGLVSANPTPFSEMGQAHAQQGQQRIAAVVNEDVISIFDLAARLRLIVASSRLQDTPETRRRLLPQVLRSLIDEQLQLQEAKRLNLTVSDQEIQGALSKMAEQNNVPVEQFGDFLAQSNLEISTVIAQIRAGFAWRKVVAQRIRPQVRVSEDEVDEVLKRISRNQSSTQFKIAEIFLSNDTTGQEQSVRETAERLSKQIQEGADFNAVARQFSQSASAGSGGDVGWVQSGQIDADLEAGISGLQPGQISAPIETRAGIYILKLIDKRSVAPAAPDEQTITLQDIVIPAPEDATDDKLDAQKEVARKLSEDAKDCVDLAKISGRLGVAASSGPIKVKISELAEDLRPIAANLAIGKASEPISKEDGIHVFMVCEREEPANMPQRREIQQSLARERLNVLMRRYLRDLRLGAFLEVRV